MTYEEKAINNIKEYLDNVNSDDIRKATQYNDNYGYATMEFAPFTNNDLEIIINFITRQNNLIHKLAKELSNFVEEDEEEIIKRLEEEIYD